jgi:hypothetical protein
MHNFQIILQTYAPRNLRFQSESENYVLESARFLYVFGIHTLCLLS